MKYLFLILIAAGFAACGTGDLKATSLTQSQKDSAAKDTAHYTKIQWLDSTYLDLGKVKEGQVVEVSFRFRNAGNNNLIISNVTASCGCTVPEKPERPYAPGEEGVIKAKFDSKGRPHGEARKSVYVDANTEPQRQELNFRVEITD